ncbi:MAG: hypothetical protein K0S47_2457 [Herbinix sp.]|nr:hypothetical protein [Herbinix sp.]
MSLLPGVYQAQKKDASFYYRASITYRGKHISLGSFTSEEIANAAYLYAGNILNDSTLYQIDHYQSSCPISLEKWVVLINFRDNKLYFKNPIYLKKRYFLYYLNRDDILKFDVDDLFYYANHKIMKRGGHLFVSDYGMQVSVLSRYGIKIYAVCGRDFTFANGDSTDFRYGNIELINRYHGVTKVWENGRFMYLAKIHINGDYLIGRYSTDVEAAVAYNKASYYLKQNGFSKNYPQNYIDELDEISYASLYQRIRISRKVLTLFSDVSDK